MDKKYKCIARFYENYPNAKYSEYLNSDSKIEVECFYNYWKDKGYVIEIEEKNEEENNNINNINFPSLYLVIKHLQQDINNEILDKEQIYPVYYQIKKMMGFI